jgi:hypothetical protein
MSSASEILRRIAGIEVFPVISLVIFVAVFAGVILWAVRADRRRLDLLASLPLAETTPAADRTPPDEGSQQ